MHTEIHTLSFLCSSEYKVLKNDSILHVCGIYHVYLFLRTALMVSVRWRVHAQVGRCTSSHLFYLSQLARKQHTLIHKDSWLYITAEGQAHNDGL
jgi:hypothetical protein